MSISAYRNPCAARACEHSIDDDCCSTNFDYIKIVIEKESTGYVGYNLGKAGLAPREGLAFGSVAATQAMSLQGQWVTRTEFSSAAKEA
jgi:hypothetical protein